MLPHIFPHVILTTQQCSRWTKKRRAQKNGRGQICINSFLAHKYSHDCWLWFFLGGRLRVPTRRCDLVVPADWGWGRSKEIKAVISFEHRGEKPMLEHFWRSFFFFFGWCLMFLPYFFVFFLALVHLQVSYACAWYFVRGLGTLLCTLSHGLHVWSRVPVGSILRRSNKFLRRRETISNL